MIEFAKEVHTGKRVHVKYADKKKEYICEHCGVKLSPVQGTEREWSYRCVDVLHKRSICAQMTHKTNYIYNADQMEPACFFDGLFRVENGRGPEGPGGPQTPPGTPPRGGSGPKPIEIVPCRTLRQLWDAKVAELPHNMPISNGILSDVFIKQKNFWRYMDGQGALNNRVLELLPIKYYQDAKVIVFAAQWGKKIEDGYQNREKLFLLRLSDDELFKNVRNSLFERVIQEDGRSKTERTYDSVLVAGCWRVCNEDEYRSYGVHPYEKCIGVQIANCMSHKQIYLIPKKRRNKK